MKPRQPPADVLDDEAARGRCQFRPTRAECGLGKMRGRPRMTSTLDAPCSPPARPTRPRPGLSRLRRRVPARRAARLLRVFRPARGRLRRRRAAPGHPGADRGRAARTSGGTRRCCRSGQDPATRVTLDPGLTPLVRADALAAEVGLRAPLWVKDDSANPTHSFKDRVVSVALTAAQGARLHPVRLRLHRQPGQLGGRARGPGRGAVDGLHPGRPGARQDRHDRGLRRRPGRHRRARTTT